MPGENIDTGSGTSTSNPTIRPPGIANNNTELGMDAELEAWDDEETVEDLEEDQNADDSDEEISRAVYDVLCISDT